MPMRFYEFKVFVDSLTIRLVLMILLAMRLVSAVRSEERRVGKEC